MLFTMTEIVLSFILVTATPLSVANLGPGPINRFEVEGLS